ncbi:MAG: hypothetical protein LBT59_29925 [Clostridiales bacterium]|nr:hypothetical protein [Clostridiales bacterium]
MGKDYLKSYKIKRFSSEFGPSPLFERVRFKMQAVHELVIKGKHFNERASERNVPDLVMKKIKTFNSSEWILRTAEVRVDRGKFISSTWELAVDGRKYWITIGVGSCVVTIVEKTSSGIENCIRSGPVYDFVEEVNRNLMDKEKGGQ